MKWEPESPLVTCPALTWWFLESDQLMFELRSSHNLQCICHRKQLHKARVNSTVSHDGMGCVLVFGQVDQVAIGDSWFACPCVANKQKRNLQCKESVKEENLSCSVHGSYDDLTGLDGHNHDTKWCFITRWLDDTGIAAQWAYGWKSISESKNSWWVWGQWLAVNYTIMMTGCSQWLVAWTDQLIEWWVVTGGLICITPFYTSMRAYCNPRNWNDEVIL